MGRITEFFTRNNKEKVELFAQYLTTSFKPKQIQMIHIIKNIHNWKSEDIALVTPRKAAEEKITNFKPT